MNELITIDNVKGYLDQSGTAHLNLENVARGLGFVQVKNNVEYVRWETVLGYLSEFGFSQPVGKDDFIPENIFYKLCFKASNETARKFQDKVTDEVLPSIRRHGAYMTPAKIEEVLLNPDTVIQLATALKEEQAKTQQLQQTIEERNPAYLFGKALSASGSSLLTGEFAKILKQSGLNIGQEKLFEWLREKGFLLTSGDRYNMPSEYSIRLGIMEYSSTVINTPRSTKTKYTPRITSKGQEYFIKLFQKKLKLRESEQINICTEEAN